MANQFNRPNPTNKKPVTRPGAKAGKRNVKKKQHGIATPHKGSNRNANQNSRQQYPRQQ